VPFNSICCAKHYPDKISAAMTGETSEPVDIDVAASVDKTQIVQLITDLQTLIKSV